MLATLRRIPRHAALPFVGLLAVLRRIAGYDTRIIEVLHAVLLFVWTVLLCLPLQLFPTAAMHQRMAALATEQTWGVGAILALFIVTIGLLKDSPDWRRLGSMIGVIWWGTVAVNGILSNVAASGPWVYLVITHFLAWAYIRGRD